jgi:hypothetical protein
MIDNEMIMSGESAIAPVVEFDEDAYPYDFGN